jgi:hypothetical protein
LKVSKKTNNNQQAKRIESLIVDNLADVLTSIIV